MDSGLGSFRYKQVKSLSRLSLQLFVPAGEELSDLTRDDRQHPVTFLEVSHVKPEKISTRGHISDYRWCEGTWKWP